MLSPAAKARTFQVSSLGETAKGILDSAGEGSVIAVFSRSFYVRLRDDIVCFGPPGLGLGPLNVLCALPADLDWVELGVENGGPVMCGGTDIRIGRSHFFRLGATAWRGQFPEPFPSAQTARGLQRLAASARRRQPGALGAVIAELCETSFPALQSQSPIDPLLSAAAPSIAALRRCVAAALAGVSAPVPDVAPLAGLGPGLTPSGDDFLAGIMVGLHYSGHPEIAARLAAQVLPAVTQGSNVISAAHVKCAAQGQASKTLFDALGSLAGADSEQLETRLDAVHAIGHTSGWDMLAGAVLACASVCAAMGHVPDAPDSRTFR